MTDDSRRDRAAGATPHPDSRGASRGEDHPSDAEQASAGGRRAAASTEYAANTEAGGPDEGYVKGRPVPAPETS
jgi:hypothetical protein